MTRLWDLGNGKKLDDRLVPYQYGSADYYHYVAQKRREAAGDSGPQKSARLKQLELSLEQDKLALPEWQREQAWKDTHNASQEEYAKELAAYRQSTNDWEAGGDDFVREMDHRGKAATGYHLVGPDGKTVTPQATPGRPTAGPAAPTGEPGDTLGGAPQPLSWTAPNGKEYYLQAGQYVDAGGQKYDPATGGALGAAEEGTYAGLAGYWQSDDAAFSGLGKAGGVGNQNPAAGIDNSWNELDGEDVRTAEQRFYDRNLKNVHESADAEGHYSWYGEETGYDPSDANASRTVNLDELENRKTSPADVDPGKQAGGAGAYAQSGGSPYDYNSVNGYGISYGDYLNDVRSRKNLSTWGRTS